jgi:hypothetical protein
MSSETAKKGGPFVHGLYAKDVLLPWDDREEFAALHRGLKQEFFPTERRGVRARPRATSLAKANAMAPADRGRAPRPVHR